MPLGREPWEGGPGAAILEPGDLPGTRRSRRTPVGEHLETASASLAALTIPPVDPGAADAASRRQARLTKPPGSLGMLEEISIRLAAITGRLDPPLQDAVVFVLAGDHGVAEDGVSAYPQEVTGQMVLNFLRGGAAVNVLARQVAARVVVAALGVAA